MAKTTKKKGQRNPTPKNKTIKKKATLKKVTKRGPSKKEKAKAQAIIDAKKILVHIPAQADIEGKSLEELAIIWTSILESEKALDRDEHDFLDTFNEHCEALRRISRLRRKINGEPEPVLRT